jgi:hypothetical protein
MTNGSCDGKEGDVKWRSGEVQVTSSDVQVTFKWRPGDVQVTFKLKVVKEEKKVW